MHILLFWDEQFPSVDTCAMPRSVLEAAFTDPIEPTEDSRIEFVTAGALARRISDPGIGLFVNPYGSAYPQSAEDALLEYITRGGYWLNLGGAPLTRPVRKAGRLNGAGTWDVRFTQLQAPKACAVRQVFPVELPANYEINCPRLDMDISAALRAVRPLRAWSLQVRFTHSKEFPDEGGSSGPREAEIHPLAVVESDGRRVAAPVVAIDRLLGTAAGARWVLANCHTALPFSAGLIRSLAQFTIKPRVAATVRSTFACYYPGEKPALRIDLRSARRATLKVNLRVYERETQREVYAETRQVEAHDQGAELVTKPFSADTPGLYIARCHVEELHRSKPAAWHESGFWVYDRRLMRAGAPITVHGDYLVRGGRVLPVTGTTYMAGDVHRKFLFEPNPAVWDSDFAEMANAGVNFVRTGIWTGWSRIMANQGDVDEGVLRAAVAFMHAARRYDLPVIFTLFAFLPPAWGAQNPYLDPIARSAQRAFARAFAARVGDMQDLVWDFINEPSWCSPERVWSTRPNYDQFDAAVWEASLPAQPMESKERWRSAEVSTRSLPTAEDFTDRYIFQDTHPLKALDYRMLAQHEFANWARDLAGVVRQYGNAGQLVTVGQDEGGTGERPNPHFYHTAVDFTTNHSWWQNDSLLWDSVITHVRGVPNLLQETGVMFTERPDGVALRTEVDCRNLLERKMALSFAAGCAGFIQWLWNTNVYMDSDNEAGIGFLRADGTEKPELNAFRAVSKFMAANAHKMEHRQPADVAIVVPHSGMFGVRDYATAATRRAVRVLEYHLGLACRSVAEHEVESAQGARWILVPSAHNLTNRCWKGLLKLADGGANVLITGFIDRDEYWRPAGRMSGLGIVTEHAPVSRTETMPVDGDSELLVFTFGGDAIQKFEKAVAVGGTPMMFAVHKHGLGTIQFCPVPVELCDSECETEALYRIAASLAGLETRARRELAPGLLAHKQSFAQDDLWILVNESSQPVDYVPLYGSEKYFEICIPAGRIAMAFVRRNDGNVTARFEVD